VRYGFHLNDNPAFDCTDCTKKQRDVRNCHNHKNFASLILLKSEWKEVTANHHHSSVLKIGDLKFMSCPVSTITTDTWDILALVSETTDGDCNILNLPFAGTIIEQPQWYRQAVKIVKSERAKHQQERLKRGK
jgi:hypothetical protein